jgi:hypothetical protein
MLRISVSDYLDHLDMTYYFDFVAQTDVAMLTLTLYMMFSFFTCYSVSGVCVVYFSPCSVLVTSLKNCGQSHSAMTYNT